MAEKPSYEPVRGRTYSLFGKWDTTSAYYEKVTRLVDLLLAENQSDILLLEKIRQATRPGFLSKVFNNNDPTSTASRFLNELDEDMGIFLLDIKHHLKELGLFSRLRSSLGTLEWQYALYMLEIELTNRINIEEFHSKPFRFALLPHCLRDIWDSCKAEYEKYDQVCQHCKKDCYINHLSRILRSKDIQPFIWTTRKLDKMFREILKDHAEFGVLGVACIPELVAGMRRSMDSGIPAIGLPLNANCCIRWFGEYKQTSVDLDQLEKLLNE